MESVYYELGGVNNHDTSAYVFHKQFLCAVLFTAKYDSKFRLTSLYVHTVQ